MPAKNYYTWGWVVTLTVLLYATGATSVSALTISPVKIEVAGDPGTTLYGELELMNEQVEQKTFYASFENFEPNGDAGSPKFVGGGTGLASWITTDPSVILSSNQTVKIPYRITIPADAEAGGYFAAVFWGEQDPETLAGGEVAIGGKLGMLILLRVNGDISEAAGITEFGTESGSRLYSHVPINFVYRFANTGADRIAPKGEVVLTNVWGSEVVRLPANPGEGNVLPNSARRFVMPWLAVAPLGEDPSFFALAGHQWNNFHLGPYTAALSLSWSSTEAPLTSSYTVWLFPWQLMTMVVTFIFVLLFLLRRYNAWIISRSRPRT